MLSEELLCVVNDLPKFLVAKPFEGFSNVRWDVVGRVNVGWRHGLVEFFGVYTAGPTMTDDLVVGNAGYLP